MVTHDIRSAIHGNRILYLEDGKILDELSLSAYQNDDGKIRERKLSDWLSSLSWQDNKFYGKRNGENIMSELKENRMGTEPIPSLLLRTAVPLMLSLLANNLYNMVDSIFISHVSEDALTALSMASPVQQLMAALGCGIAIGLNAAVSKALGEKNREKARQTASAAIFLGICAWMIHMLCCVLFVKHYFYWQTAGNQIIAEYGISYLRICMLFSIGQMMQWVFDRLIIASGKSMLFLITLGMAAVVNLILDPILIFGYLGFKPMGSAGAAIATVIGQSCGAVLGVVLNIRYNKEIPIRFTLKPDKRMIFQILRVGIPTSIMQGLVSFMGIIMNTILYSFSSTAVAVYGICVRIQNLAGIPVHGIDNGLIPIVAYNYGAKMRKRIDESIRWALIYALVLTGIVTILLEVFPAQILYLFDASETMLSIGSLAIRILAVSWLLSVFGFVISTTFQALGNGNYSMYVTVTRQVVLPVGFAFLLSRMGSLWIVWIAFLVSEILAMPLILYLFGRTKKMIINQI